PRSLRRPSLRGAPGGLDRAAQGGPTRVGRGLGVRRQPAVSRRGGARAAPRRPSGTRGAVPRAHRRSVAPAARRPPGGARPDRLPGRRAVIVDAPARPRRRLSVPHLLRGNATFRSYWGAHTVSLFGDQITLLAIPLVAVLSLDASAREMGYLTAVALAPNLLFALHAGAWVDRRGRRRVTMIVCDLGRAALLASVPIAYFFDVLTFPQLYAVAFGAGTLSVLFNVSDASLFQTIVPRDRFVEASSLLNGSRAFSFVAGPT